MQTLVGPAMEGLKTNKHRLKISVRLRGDSGSLGTDAERLVSIKRTEQIENSDRTLCEHNRVSQSLLARETPAESPRELDRLRVLAQQSTNLCCGGKHRRLVTLKRFFGDQIVDD